jgi:hypothetical protein
MIGYVIFSAYRVLWHVHCELLAVFCRVLCHMNSGISDAVSDINLTGHHTLYKMDIFSNLDFHKPRELYIERGA